MMRAAIPGETPDTTARRPQAKAPPKQSFGAEAFANRRPPRRGQVVAERSTRRLSASRLPPHSPLRRSSCTSAHAACSRTRESASSSARVSTSELSA